ATSRKVTRKPSIWSETDAATSSRSSSGRRARPRASISSSVCWSDIKQPPSLKRSSERHLVGVLQIAADRKSTCWTGYPQAHWFHQPGEICRSRLTLEVGIGGEDEFDHRAVGESNHELAYAQIVRADAVDRADRAAEDVIATAKLARPLDRDDVLGFF